MIQGNPQNGNGLILGVPPDIATQMLVPQELLHQSHQLGNRILQNTLPSPQSDFMGGYTSQSTPAPLPQVRNFPLYCLIICTDTPKSGSFAIHSLQKCTSFYSIDAFVAGITVISKYASSEQWLSSSE